MLYHSVITISNDIRQVSPLLMSTACGLCAHVPSVPIHNRLISSMGVSPVIPIVVPVQKYIVKSEECTSGGHTSFNTGWYPINS